MESASAVSDAPSDANPSVLRESKKLCARGGCLSLISAAGGESSAGIGATSNFADGGGAFKAMAPLAVEDELAAEAGADAGESDVAAVAGAGAAESSVEAVAAEAGVGEAGLREEECGPRSSVANADAAKIANNMAHAMASFTRAPRHVSATRYLENPSRKPGSND